MTCDIRFAALGRLVILEVAAPCEEQRLRFTGAAAIQDPGTRHISLNSIERPPEVAPGES